MKINYIHFSIDTYNITFNNKNKDLCIRSILIQRNNTIIKLFFVKIKKKKKERRINSSRSKLNVSTSVK